MCIRDRIAGNGIIFKVAEMGSHQCVIIPVGTDVKGEMCIRDSIHPYLVSFIHILYLVFFLLYSLRKLKLNPTYI